MDATAQDANTYVGIDVSKDQLDVHIHPAGEAFSVSRDTAGLEELIEKLKPLPSRPLPWKQLVVLNLLSLQAFWQTDCR